MKVIPQAQPQENSKIFAVPLPNMNSLFAINSILLYM